MATIDWRDEKDGDERTYPQPSRPEDFPPDLGNDHRGDPTPDPRPDPRPAPSYSADQAREDLRRRGASEHVAGEEAANIARYGSVEAAERANPGTMARFLQRSSSGGAPAPGPRPSSNPDPRFVGSQFNDPYTEQYEGLLRAQMELLRLQQEEMRRAAEEAQRKRAAAQAAWDRFSGYANERVTRLQGPAYTGTEQEVLRTQLLDPIERDRTAAHKRALEQISARGFEPDSGLAAELQRLVDQEFNQYRSGAQGTLAQRQIQEQRSREQEAQQLLMTLAQMPDAIARGDLDFVNTVHGLISAPGTQQIALGDILSELPSRRLRDALAVLGVAPQGLSPMGSTSPQMMQLLQLLQNQRFGQNNAWGNVFGNMGLNFQP